MPTRRGPEPTYELGGIRWRLIGPFRGGRVVAVAGDPADRNVFYFGSTGGGVWKTVDAGLYWENVSDPFFRRASVGALAVAGSDSNVVYAGMGEACIRGNVSHGDGVYRSTDAGRTWNHLGLAATRTIGRVRVDPRDPDVVYVAALGHAHGPNPDRGVFRSRDGGRSWRRVLYRGPRAGAVDLSIDLTNPRVVYATTWEATRTPWGLSSGGPGSGLFRSMDGGDSWADLSERPGLPKGPLGRIGIASSPARSGRVWAVIEAGGGGVFRSDDGGDRWVRASEQRALRQRAWYYQHIVADPLDPETVWVLNVDPWRSTDAGATFEAMSIPHGDHHDLWIDPRDPSRMIEGNDFGATVSLNAGESWSGVNNQPTAEMYHVTTDTRIPYRVYGAQQDTTTISVPSRSALWGITALDSYAVGGGESGYVAVDRLEPDVVFAGSYQGQLTRYDHRTGQARSIQVWPESSAGERAADVRHRFQWTYPIVISPHDPDRLYVGANRIFTSLDRGETWKAISPDLSRNDPKTLGPSGGPINHDNTGAEYYGTVFALAESPVRPGVLWAGSDDGLVHVSTDRGRAWRSVTPRLLPKWSLISAIEPSRHRPDTAFVAATRHKLDDFRPYLFRTDDLGRTWRAIVRGIPKDDFMRVIREDPEREGLLFAGTETGVYVSFDGGASWRRIVGNLPAVPIHDFVIHGADLVAATHGRSFWILDDISSFRQVRPGDYGRRATLFKPRRVIRFRSEQGFLRAPRVSKNYRVIGPANVTFRQTVDPETGERSVGFLDAGSNPPDGVIVDYRLRSRTSEVTLTFLDAQRTRIVSFASTAAGPRPSAGPGLHRFVWSLRYPSTTQIDGPNGWDERAILGPLAPPGEYVVRLQADGDVLEQPFAIDRDPRLGCSDMDLRGQFEFLIAIRDKIGLVHGTINRIRSVRERLALSGNGPGGFPTRLRSHAHALDRGLRDVEERLVQVRATSRQDNLNYPARLNAKLAALALSAGSADGSVTVAQQAVFTDLSRRVDRQLARWDSLLARDPALRRLALAYSRR